jgi:sensor histidine kinase YesM
MMLAFRGSDRRATMLAFLFLWTVIAVVAATTTFIALSGSSVGDWLDILGIMLRYFYTWAAISLVVNRLVQTRSPTVSRLGVQIPAHLCLLALIMLVLPFWTHPASWERWLYGDRAAGFHALNVFIYSFVLFGSMLWKYYRVGREKEAAAQAARLRQAELERSLDRTRMEALRAQINPHFLFNTLNSIASLIESSSNREAYKVIELLAELLRSSLDYARDSIVTLEEELRFLDAYVAIEKVRYAERLHVSKAVPEECLALEVPSFSLQPLVENAIKHAVSKTTDPVSIGIDVICDEEAVRISIADDGPGIRGPRHRGVGLANLEDRLKCLFGSAASLDIRNNDRGGATVTMLLPKQHRPVRKNQRRTENDHLTGATAACNVLRQGS